MRAIDRIVGPRKTEDRDDRPGRRARRQSRILPGLWRAGPGGDGRALGATAPVACLHPGWTALKDRDAIIESWAGILSNPDAPRIACYDEQAFVYGDVALVLCEEELEGGTLAASNFFVREDGVWRIAHHQAGQIVRRQAERRRPSRLN